LNADASAPHRAKAGPVARENWKKQMPKRILGKGDSPPGGRLPNLKKAATAGGETAPWTASEKH